MEAVNWIVVIGVFFVLPMWVGRNVATAKGYSQWVGIILGLCLSLIGLAITFMLSEEKWERKV